MHAFLTLLGTTAAFLATRLFFAETAAVFSPTLAITFFAAIWARQTVHAIATPLVAYLIGDALLGTGHATLVIYANLLGFAALGRIVATQSRLAQYASVALGITVFDLTTNLAVWAGDLYPHTSAGLAACFIASWPFYVAKLNGLVAVAALHHLFTSLRRPAPALAA